MGEVVEEFQRVAAAAIRARFIDEGIVEAGSSVSPVDRVAADAVLEAVLGRPAGVGPSSTDLAIWGGLLGVEPAELAFVLGAFLGGLLRDGEVVLPPPEEDVYPFGEGTAEVVG